MPLGINNKSLSVWLVVAVYVLTFFGLYNLLNVASEQDAAFLSSLSKFKSQIVAIILGSVALCFAYKCDYVKLRNFLTKRLFGFRSLDITPLFIITVILLIIAGYISPAQNDVHRWIDLKICSFQPSEFA
ncbi:FtsW/RodA/SpoVE family cell cycle protein, partial [bacterium]|nr:FtsW/RodA/SpoVE family cell cycle protein [bacterium]